MLTGDNTRGPSPASLALTNFPDVRRGAQVGGRALKVEVAVGDGDAGASVRGPRHVGDGPLDRARVAVHIDSPRRRLVNQTAGLQVVEVHLVNIECIVLQNTKLHRL